MSTKNNRFIIHNRHCRISFGMEVKENGDVYASVAACNKKDQFCKRDAFFLLNTRLDHAATRHAHLLYQQISKQEKLNGHFPATWYAGRYGGENPGKDLFVPIKDYLRTLDTRRDVRRVILGINEIFYDSILNSHMENSVGV